MTTSQSGYTTEGEAATQQLDRPSGLPFTGADLAPLLAVALLLVALGTLTRRLTNQG